MTTSVAPAVSERRFCAAADDERAALRAAARLDEGALLRRLLAAAEVSAAARREISGEAARLIEAVRQGGKVGILEAFLAEYGLSTREGVALMCLAEAMLRVPDAATVGELISDKITPHDWAAHLGDSGSVLVNASTWALLLTGRVLEEDEEGIAGTLHGLLRRLGEPVILKAVRRAMAEMGRQFVLGQTIGEAQKAGADWRARGYTYSFDMLGEAACTEADARRYQAAYADAIAHIAGGVSGDSDSRANPGISIKLSALSPRFELAQRERVLPVVSERLLALATAAAEAGIGLNVDAEEAERLEPTMDVFETVLAAPALAGWDGMGIVVQAYGRRALPLIEWLERLAVRLRRRIMVRLVKGAYWDTEIKRGQVLGLDDYPVFTRKTHTDISYIACAKRLLEMRERVYPQFATHNAHTVAAVRQLAGAAGVADESYEFQRLHGMGEALYEVLRNDSDCRCRIYAPVGAHEDLLAYLVRRLLENGANSSFVNQLTDESLSAEVIARDPFDAAEAAGLTPHPAVVSPARIFSPRENSRGCDLSDAVVLAELERSRVAFAAPYEWRAAPLTPAAAAAGETVAECNQPVRVIVNPARVQETVGQAVEADDALVQAAVSVALAAQPRWQGLAVAQRADILYRAAALYEQHSDELLALLAREAGKTLPDAVADLREAVDFLRYYADAAVDAAGGGAQAVQMARGVIVCISPWNFPLAIFSGQVVAALAAGNAVIAKPAEQTPLIAHRATELLLAAGVPADVLQCLPGDGTVGAALVADARIAGVCFTGSTAVAKNIDRCLAQRAPAALLIAETGGLNAMVVDSTALLEQAVRDIVKSAFQSAGQRCSALRLLYVQKDIAARLMEMLTGALQTLVLGDPWDSRTDMGPLIDGEAHEAVLGYCRERRCVDIGLPPLPEGGKGWFMPPTLIEVAGIQDVPREVFGPVLHVATFAGNEIEQVIADINSRGYGLTFGLHTRIDKRVQFFIDRLAVGNIYVNRDQIGAVVGAQPFGGRGLSGTGPKAGGPLYLPRLLCEGAAGGGSGDSKAEGEAAGGVELSSIRSEVEKLDITGWARRTDRVAVVRAALRGRAAAAIRAAAGVDCGPIDLPGPTGEANQYRLLPRGCVLCLGDGDEALLAQVVQALVAGNGVVAVAGGAAAVLRPLLNGDFPLLVLEGDVAPEQVAAARMDAVALTRASSAFAAVRCVLAAREGAILPLIDELLAPARYWHEQSVCLDTTAAGGNAALLCQVN